MLFLRSQTQWRVGGMGSRTGLDYGGVRVVAEMTGIEWNPDIFERLQTLEIATINEWAKQHGKTTGRGRNHR